MSRGQAEREDEAEREVFREGEETLAWVIEEDDTITSFLRATLGPTVSRAIFSVAQCSVAQAYRSK